MSMGRLLSLAVMRTQANGPSTPYELRNLMRWRDRVAEDVARGGANLELDRTELADANAEIAKWYRQAR